MPKICCNNPMTLIKATTGVMRQGGREYGGPPELPVRVYECGVCGDRETDVLVVLTRAERRNAGLCWECYKAAVKGRTRCHKHLLEDSASGRRYRFKNRDKIKRFMTNRRRERARDGLCIHCGRLLLPEVDGAHQCCLICRMHLYRPMGVNTWN